MAATIEVYVRRTTEGYDLVRALAVRGLIGTLETDGQGGIVAIECRREDLEHLLADLLPALDDWRADTRLSALDIRVLGRRYTLNGHGDIARCLAELHDTPVPSVAA